MAQIYSEKNHQELLSNKWDAIVIGSGLGGMTTATLLAKAGKKVLMLERHYVPGGFTHSFKRKGYEWDVGVHYVGQMENSNSILRKIFDYVSDKGISWEPMGSVYDQAQIAGETYDFVAGAENLIVKLTSYFPNEEKAIRQYIKLVRAAAQSSAWFFGEKTMPNWLSQSLGKLLRWRFVQFNKKTTYQVLKSLTHNERLISVLCAQCGDYGLAPSKSSFAIHALVIDHYLNGGSYPVGGSKQIHQSILSVFKKNGGTLLLKADVAGVIIKNNRVCGVRMNDGFEISSSIVVSNAGVRNTFKRLLPEGVLLPFDLDASLRNVAASTGHICLYLGLDGSDSDLLIPKHNIWIYDSYDYELDNQNGTVNPLGNNTLTYISFPSAKDPKWSETQPDKATIQVITGCSFDQVKKWEKQFFGNRCADYLEFKEQLTQKLTQKLLKALPQLKGRISYSELSTPLSTQHFMNYSEGEIYGLEHTPARFSLSFLRPSTPIKGLYLTGQDVVSVGVGGALYSGVLAATKVLNKSVILRILFNRNLK